MNHFCGVCDKSVSEPSVGCDGCPKWFHPPCVNLSLADLKLIGKKKHESNLKWFCPKCCKSSTLGNTGDNSGVTLQSLSDLILNLEQRLCMKIETSVELIYNKIDAIRIDMDSKVAAIDVKVVSCVEKVNEIERNHSNIMEYIERSEKYRRLPNFIIRGVPENIVGDKAAFVVEAIAASMNVVIPLNSITSCYHFKKKGDRLPDILVRCSMKSVRDLFIDAFHARKMVLRLSDVFDTDVASRIYLNEHVTKEVGSMVSRCASLKRDGHIVGYFVRNGYLFIKQLSSDNSSKKVNSPADFLRRFPV